MRRIDTPETVPARINRSVQLHSLYADLQPRGLRALWTVLHELVPPTPASGYRPAHWRYGDVRPLLTRAGETISAEEAVRRVLVFENPAAIGSAAVTPTLYAGLQLLLPGEIAPVHRHTQSALRFIMEGSGAYTTVRGERFPMYEWDLILTPNMEWHDHGHAGDRPVVWLDGLDIPLVRALDAAFAESGTTAAQAVTHPEGMNAARWGRGLRPVIQSERAAAVERFAYPFAEWRAAFEQCAGGQDPDPHDAHRLEFVNPLDGGPVLPTLSAFCQLVPAGMSTRRQRRTDGSVFVVVEGQGSVVAGTQRFALAPRDVCVVPSWHEFQFAADATLVLFSFSDRATQMKLGLHRQERLL